MRCGGGLSKGNSTGTWSPGRPRSEIGHLPTPAQSGRSSGLDLAKVRVARSNRVARSKIINWTRNLVLRPVWLFDASLGQHGAEQQGRESHVVWIHGLDLERDRVMPNDHCSQVRPQIVACRNRNQLNKRHSRLKASFCTCALRWRIKACSQHHGLPP